MTPNELPSDVLALLRDRVPGPTDLEMLLLMRDDAARGWTASALATRLGLPEAWALDSVEAMRSVALVEEDGSMRQRRFFYRPATPALAATVSRLARIYQERPGDVVRTLNDNAIARVRLAALQAFPVAFLLRADAG